MGAEILKVEMVVRHIHDSCVIRWGSDVLGFWGVLVTRQDFYLCYFG